MCEIIIPQVSMPPFAIKYGMWWEPGWHPFNQRDYYIVYEVAAIMKKRRIIRKTNDGLQQVRKHIRGDADNQINNCKLYRNSRKFGYMIPKKDFCRFFEEMTNTEYKESEFVDCLLGSTNHEWFFDLKLTEFNKKITKNNQKMASGELTESEKEAMIKQNQVLQEKINMYRSLWLKAVL